MTVEWRQRSDLGVVEIRLSVEPWARNMRLDRYLCARFSKLSRSRARRIIESTLTLNGAPPKKPGVLLHPGDEVVIQRPIKSEPPAPDSVPLIADFGGFLAVDKPAGLPVHPTGRYYKHTVTTILRETFGEKLVVAHRLDRETSGVLLVCRSKDAERRIKRMFQERAVHKRYLAVVRGRVTEAGRIDLPLATRQDSRIAVKMHVVDDGAPASTTFRPLAVWKDFSLVEAQPLTGRQHQIRAHLSALGHPVLGDKMYGVETDVFFEFIRNGMTPDLEKRLLLSRQALHALSLTMPHPDQGGALEIIAPLADDIRAFLSGLGRPDFVAQDGVDVAWWAG